MKTLHIRARVSALIIATLGVGMLSVAQAPDKSFGQPNATLVQETFTHATADANFVGFGPACLTGAPTAATPPSGDHPLGGCTQGVGPVPPNNADPFGYLRLTDDSLDQSSAVLYNTAIPANGGLDVTFDQWQYGSTAIAPADGINFFLVNGATELQRPGAFGGSLGYAQKLTDDIPTNPFIPGVDDGYVGVGLDVLGNYFGDWEHRGNGCPPGQRSPAGTSFRVPAPGSNMVTLRGPGNGVDGYCFLTATTSNFTTTGPWPSTLPGQLQGVPTVMPPDATPQQAETILEPSRRRVNVHITPAPNPVITVSIDFNDGTGFHQVLSNPAPQPVPASYKFGFAASTGLFNDVHLIRNVDVTSAVPLPQLNLVKQVAQPLPDVIEPGTKLQYQYVVTNTGNTTINNLAVTDDKVSPITCQTTTLAPGHSTTCTGTYTVQAADTALGHITNTATATGTSDGNTINSPPVTNTLDIPQQPEVAIQLAKTVDNTHSYNVGDTVTYHYKVQNVSSSTVTGLHINDNTVQNITCDSTTLAPEGQPGDSTECTGTFVVPAGSEGQTITNTAQANADHGVHSDPDSASIDVEPEQVSGLSLTKKVDTPPPYNVGDTVNYSYTVTNTGNTTLTGITVGDDTVQNITCEDTTLAPGEDTTCSGTFVIPQGSGGTTITNVARASSDQGIESEQATADIDVEPEPVRTIQLDKEVDNSHPYNVGDTVHYTYRVRNTGNTTLSGLTIEDNTVNNITCEDTTLAPGESTTCTGTFVIPESDAGKVITNVAVAHADDVESNIATAEIEVNEVFGLILEKEVDNPNPSVGETVHYTYRVTNVGSSTVSGLTITDNTVHNITCQSTTLAPGESTTCTGTFTPTAADAGRVITNTAVAHADGVESNEDTATIDVAPQRVGLNLEKSVDNPNPSVGETVHYTYRVTNVGETTLTGLTIKDDTIQNITCQETTLPPGESTTCTGSFTPTDTDAGRVITNRAVAHAGGVESNEDSATIEVQQAVKVGLELTKKVEKPRLFKVGDTVTYTYTVTNTGNTRVTGVNVTDDKVSDITCESTTLEPGEHTTCTGTFTITKEDVEKGKKTDCEKDGKKDGEKGDDKGGWGDNKHKDKKKVRCVAITNTAVAHADHGIRSEPAKATIKVQVRKHKKEEEEKEKEKGHKHHHKHHKHHKQVHKIPHGPIESGDGTLATSYLTELRAS